MIGEIRVGYLSYLRHYMPDNAVNTQDKCLGSALISALFIMTLVAIAATAMSTRLQLDIYRTHLTITSDKLYLASEAATFWAMNTLLADKTQFKTGDKKGLLASFPKQLQRAYPDVITQGNLYDMQAFFNINNLQDKKFHPLLFRLLENSLTKMEDAQRKSLIEAIYYWISPYQPDRGHDKYLDYYLQQHPAYFPSYQAMQSISELRLVHGVSASIYQTLLPNITALPEITPINLNTAPTLVLMSLGNGLSGSEVSELLKARGKKGITNMNKISQLLQKFDIPKDQITLTSVYYLCIATSVSEDLSLSTYTIIKRNTDRTGHVSVGIISKSLNTI